MVMWAVSISPEKYRKTAIPGAVEVEIHAYGAVIHFALSCHAGYAKHAPGVLLGYIFYGVSAVRGFRHAPFAGIYEEIVGYTVHALEGYRRRKGVGDGIQGYAQVVDNSGMMENVARCAYVPPGQVIRIGGRYLFPCHPRDRLRALVNTFVVIRVLYLHIDTAVTVF